MGSEARSRMGGRETRDTGNDIPAETIAGVRIGCRACFIVGVALGAGPLVLDHIMVERNGAATPGHDRQLPRRFQGDGDIDLPSRVPDNGEGGESAIQGLGGAGKKGRTPEN